MRYLLSHMFVKLPSIQIESNYVPDRKIQIHIFSFYQHRKLNSRKWNSTCSGRVGILALRPKKCIGMSRKMRRYQMRAERFLSAPSGTTPLYRQPGAAERRYVVLAAPEGSSGQ